MRESAPVGRVRVVAIGEGVRGAAVGRSVRGAAAVRGARGATETRENERNAEANREDGQRSGYRNLRPRTRRERCVICDEHQHNEVELANEDEQGIDNEAFELDAPPNFDFDQGKIFEPN